MMHSNEKNVQLFFLVFFSHPDTTASITSTDMISKNLPEFSFLWEKLPCKFCRTLWDVSGCCCCCFLYFWHSGCLMKHFNSFFGNTTTVFISAWGWNTTIAFRQYAYDSEGNAYISIKLQCLYKECK